MKSHQLMYEQDVYVFNSPALAAGVLLGHEISNLKIWKDGNGLDFTELRDK